MEIQEKNTFRECDVEEAFENAKTISKIDLLGFFKGLSDFLKKTTATIKNSEYYKGP